jgi:hypothetical protein
LSKNDELKELKEANYIDPDKIGLREFSLRQDLNNDEMKDTLGMARYVNYKGDTDYLTEMSLKALDVKKIKAKEADSTIEQYMEIIFAKSISLENEIDCWYLLLWKIDDALKLFPTTL